MSCAPESLAYDPTLGGIQAEVKTVSWRAISLHTEMTVWVRCWRAGTAWTLPLEVLPTLDVREPDLYETEPSKEVRLAALLVASTYVAKNRAGLKEIFRQSYGPSPT
jgi:hypothetical protein